MFNLIPLGFAAFMACIDTVAFSFLKEISIKSISSAFFPFVVLLYSFQPWIFLQSLKYESMTVMNIMWDLSSDILVTLFGLFVLGERIGFRKAVGIALSFVAMYLFTFEDGHSALETSVKEYFGFKS